jgi:hypothetical protein
LIVFCHIELLQKDGVGFTIEAESMAEKKKRVLAITYGSADI